MPSTLENWITLAVHNTITEKDSLILICHQWRQWDTTQTNIPHYIHHLWSNFQLVNCLLWRQSKIDMYHHKRWIGNRRLFLFVVCLPPGERGLPPLFFSLVLALSATSLSLILSKLLAEQLWTSNVRRAVSSRTTRQGIECRNVHLPPSSPHWSNSWCPSSNQQRVFSSKSSSSEMI